MLGEVKTDRMEWVSRMMRVAVEVSTWSKDPRRKVGALVISPDRRRVSWGYNGFPPGIADLKQRLTSAEEKNLLTVHAEQNALANAAFDVAGCTLFSTRCLCHECAKLALAHRVGAVVCPSPDESSKWHESHDWAMMMLREAGVLVTHVTIQQD